MSTKFTSLDFDVNTLLILLKVAIQYPGFTPEDLSKCVFSTKITEKF